MILCNQGTSYQGEGNPEKDSKNKRDEEEVEEEKN